MGPRGCREAIPFQAGPVGVGVLSTHTTSDRDFLLRSWERHNGYPIA